MAVVMRERERYSGRAFGVSSAQLRIAQHPGGTRVGEESLNHSTTSGPGRYLYGEGSISYLLDVSGNPTRPGLGPLKRSVGGRTKHVAS
jgi:hypothetical protein